MMNDFTKEELECLHNAIALQLRNIPMSETNAIRRRELMEKLQAMLDNYCSHNDRLCNPDENGHMVVKCGNCDTILWHEKD